MPKKYDFSGWATKNNLVCSDGRTILQDAFADNDGMVVPLVWNHQHTNVNNILGHALLKNLEDGVYAYCSFNETESGKNACEMIQHGDITALSIYANQLVERGKDVLHGMIREVSLVLSGANPGAFIDTILSHGENSDGGEAIIYTGEEISLYHAEEESGEQKKKKEQKEQKADTKEDDDDDETISDVVKSMSEKQRNVMYALIAEAIDDKKNNGKEKSEGDDKTMKHNVFETEETTENTLSHAAVDTILGDAKRCGSLKESFLSHAQTYGIENIEYLFPEAKALNNTPEFIKRPDDWVSKVMNGTHHTPFSRIKSIFADITADEARAKGYIKGNLKKEEVFSLLKRTTTPTTIYKKQKLDRDDVIDITDFDVVAWIKTEMRMMLNEEIARAILVGDGRLASDDDKIQETNIRPVISDAPLYTINVPVTPGSSEELAHAFITEVIRSRKDYRGSGNPSLFTTEDMLSDILLLEDKNGRRIYTNETEVATALRVKEIVTIPVMPADYYGIIVNLIDYNVGADKGGAINLFDDFDIDYNQQKYLIETRCSGALVKPYSALVYKKGE